MFEGWVCKDFLLLRGHAMRGHAMRGHAITQPCALQLMKVAPEVQDHVLQLSAKLTNAGESLLLDLSTEEGS